MKILVVEDHQLIREMLVVTSATLADNCTVQGASTGTEAVALAKSFDPDVIFLDLALPDGDGIDFIPALFAARRNVKIIALTSHADEFTITRALRAQVNGFVDKNEQPLKVLEEAVATVMAGNRYFSSPVQRLRAAMRNDPDDFGKILSDQELRLLSLIGTGMTNEEIAEVANLTVNTAKVHRCHIMGKLNIHTTPELMRYAVAKGMTRSDRTLKPVGFSAKTS